MPALLLLAALLLGSGGCASVPTPAQRLLLADRLADAHAWRRLTLEAPPFLLTAWLPAAAPAADATGRELTVYIEGDGLAWRTRTRRSPDPTPLDPVALRLALRHPQGQVAYLARPCQYLGPAGDPTCIPEFWTSHRFAPEVVAATDHALSTLKEMTSAAALQLVGYSGGGAVAALVAARRDDVAGLRTVAGNLDPPLWTGHHWVDPLSGSLNPVDIAPRLSRLPQLHFVGGADAVIPRSVAESFLAAQGETACAGLVEVAGVGHGTGWAELWPELLKKPLPCGEAGSAGN